jgi:hypothetical protein
VSGVGGGNKGSKYDGGLCNRIVRAAGMAVKSSELCGCWHDIMASLFVMYPVSPRLAPTHPPTP